MHKGHEALGPEVEATGRAVVDAALHVHRTLGPGLLESAYELALAHTLERRGHEVLRQLTLPVRFEDVTLEAGYRIDMLVDGHVIVEVKSVEALLPVHDQQVLTYLRLSSRRLGFLINFNVALLKDGLRRKIV